MKNYYEILEVDKNASEEVLDRAYRVLAKKYHPDMQTGRQRRENEEKMKIINEAYSVLSDKQRREKYDLKLQEEIVQEKIDNMSEQNEVEIDRKVSSSINKMFNNMKREQVKEIKEKQERSFKNKMEIIIIIVLITFILGLISQIPAVSNLMNENAIIRTIFSPFSNTFKTLFKL